MAVEVFPADELEALASMRRYYAWKAALIAPFVGSRVLEAGCGNGLLLRALAERGVRRRYLGVDVNARCLTLARRHLKGRIAPELKHLDVSSSRFLLLRSFRPSSVVFCSSLEVIRRDALALRRAFAVLPPGGRVVVFASALRFLSGSLDRAHHQRRYDRGELGGMLVRAGFRIERLRYFNLLGALGMAWDNLVLRRMSAPLADYRRRDLAVPVARLLDALTGPPLGRSLLAVGVRP